MPEDVHPSRLQKNETDLILDFHTQFYELQTIFYYYRRPQYKR